MEEVTFEVLCTEQGGSTSAVCFFNRGDGNYGEYTWCINKGTEPKYGQVVR